MSDRVFTGVVVACCVFVLWAVIGYSNKIDKLMDECMKDHKEYECVGILKGNRK